MYVNLDPAAEEFAFEPDLDIKDLISLGDVMEEMGLQQTSDRIELLPRWNCRGASAPSKESEDEGIVHIERSGLR